VEIHSLPIFYILSPGTSCIEDPTTHFCIDVPVLNDVPLEMDFVLNDFNFIANVRGVLLQKFICRSLGILLHPSAYGIETNIMRAGRDRLILTPMTRGTSS
jgi:hypothetical protein